MSSNTPSDDAEEPVAWLAHYPNEPEFGKWFTHTNFADYPHIKFEPLYLHPPKPAEPEAKPVLYIKEQELLYIQVLKQEGLAQEWKSNLGFVKEDGDVGLYLHPPKPAESARKPMTEEEIDESVGKASNFDFSTDFYDGFFAGIRYAEKHHEIGGDDDKQG